MTLIQLAVLLLWLDASNVYHLLKPLYLASFTVDGIFPLPRDSTKELFLFVKAILLYFKVAGGLLNLPHMGQSMVSSALLILGRHLMLTWDSNQ